MRRLVLLAGALAAPALQVLVSAPAGAADNVICVTPASVGCNQTFSTIPLAIAAADANTLDDTILLGATTYSTVPVNLDGSTHALTLKGAGQGSTFVTLPSDPSAQNYVSADHATVRDLTITMTAATSSNDGGLVLGNGSVADHVTVIGTGTTNTRGIDTANSSASNMVVQMPTTPGTGTVAIFSTSGNTVSDATISAAEGVFHSAAGNTLTLSRMNIRADYRGVEAAAGSIVIDDSLVDLGTGFGSTGLVAGNFNNNGPLRTVTADHVTIVGGGGVSKGAWAYAAAAGSRSTATVNLTNSIVRGPETSVVADASNDGTRGGPSNATVNVSYSDVESTGGTIDTAGGTGAGGIVEGSGNVNVDPAFVSASDRHLSVGSPVIDKGNPAAGGPALDLDGLARVRDGDGNGSAIRDLGAYEVPDTTAPETTISAGPAGLTNDPTPAFAFTSEAGATFECKVDGAAYATCASPTTTASLADGPHTFSVRARDGAGNPDATPATRSFTVDTVAPATELTAKFGKQVTKKKVKVTFTSEAGATFQCQVDGKGWKSCTSPFKVKLSLGKHTIQVRAVDAAGNADASPVKVKVKRVPKGPRPPSGCTGEC